MSNIYEENGFKNRTDYLNSLSEEYGVPKAFVYSLAHLLGENEDFDGLINSIQDYAGEENE